MIPTAAEPNVFYSGPVDGVCPQDYPITYEHLINSFCFDLEASTLFIYYSQETTKKTIVPTVCRSNNYKTCLLLLFRKRNISEYYRSKIHM